MGDTIDWRHGLRISGPRVLYTLRWGGHVWPDHESSEVQMKDVSERSAVGKIYMFRRIVWVKKSGDTSGCLSDFDSCSLSRTQRLGSLGLRRLFLVGGGGSGGGHCRHARLSGFCVRLSA